MDGSWAFLGSWDWSLSVQGLWARAYGPRAYGAQFALGPMDPRARGPLGPVTGADVSEGPFPGSMGPMGSEGSNNMAYHSGSPKRDFPNYVVFGAFRTFSTHIRIISININEYNISV